MIYRGCAQTETEEGAAAAAARLFEALAKSEENAKRAIVAYLFLAMERKPDEPLLQLFDELFLTRAGETGEKFSLANGYGDFADDRDTVIRICDAYLESAANSDERYELAVEAIRGAEQGMFSHEEAAQNTPLNPNVNREKGMSGSCGFLSVNIALFVYNLVVAGMRNGIYKGNRKKLARFIVRFTKRDKAALAELEEVAGVLLEFEDFVTKVKRTPGPEVFQAIGALNIGIAADWQALLVKRLEKLLRRDLFIGMEEEKGYREAEPPKGILEGVVDGFVPVLKRPET
jgi:hypothetical protein